MQLRLIRQQCNHHKHQPVQSAQPVQPVTCVVSNLEIHSQHPSDDDQHKLKYSSSNLEIHCHHHRSDDYRHNLAIALNIKLYTLMISCPHPHRHPDDQHNLMGPGNRHDDQTLHCASFYPSTMIINSSPHPLIILSSSPLEGPAIVLPAKQLWHITCTSQ